MWCEFIDRESIAFFNKDYDLCLFCEICKDKSSNLIIIKKSNLRSGVSVIVPEIVTLESANSLFSRRIARLADKELALCDYFVNP